MDYSDCQAVRKEQAKQQALRDYFGNVLSKPIMLLPSCDLVQHAQATSMQLAWSLTLPFAGIKFVKKTGGVSLWKNGDMPPHSLTPMGSGNRQHQ